MVKRTGTKVATRRSSPVSMTVRRMSLGCVGRGLVAGRALVSLSPSALGSLLTPMGYFENCVWR